MPRNQMWHEAALLLGIWVAVGIGGIVSNIFVALQTERLAHRHRITAMGRYFKHVLALPLSFHGATHSGRIIKGMLTGTDGLFGSWLVFVRDQLSTILSAAVLLPMTLFLNWRLGLVLIVLVAVFLVFTAIVVKKTETAQRAALPFAIFSQGYRKTPISELPHDASFDDFAELPAVLDRLMPVPA
ncbi:beta-(1--_2)glucan export ATP-binding/permease protein NdvA [mine drainage metagenome]|uniref:Beta-(1-->2)glucan export ATP-binding/permease protein NdvA n=1 Tax=mine drainage metagenome TaxID=410659 RepID=A0A1J5P550_9ZZZZ